MPTIVVEGYKFRFYSLDISEPPHVHVSHGENVAKIWLAPVRVAHNLGFNEREMNHILRLTAQNEARLLEAWHGCFSR